ncbi:MAG: J domain-containing protein [Thaumarchaeota archaeon]|nr:J domain-containing protein [Nitrososphaerota archaeon]MBI3642077.1 J domain-containing protein [Nitrososphaerota archaeon]
MNTTDCYQILGVQKGASQKEIKSAYRRLSLKYHPDRNKSEKDGEKFKRIIEAYQTLKLEEKKKSKRSEVDIANTYTEFWKQYDKKVNEEQFNRANFAGFQNPFGVNVPESYSHNQEKASSQIFTHVILYVGLGLVAIWIILSEILK